MSKKMYVTLVAVVALHSVASTAVNSSGIIEVPTEGTSAMTKPEEKANGKTIPEGEPRVTSKPDMSEKTKTGTDASEAIVQAVETGETSETKAEMKEKFPLPKEVSATNKPKDEESVNLKQEVKVSVTTNTEPNIKENTVRETEVSGKTKSETEATAFTLGGILHAASVAFARTMTTTPTTASTPVTEVTSAPATVAPKSKPFEETINRTEPKIMEITTKITDEKPIEGDAYGPRIDGIEARFEPVRHAIPSKLKDKLDALSCDVPPLPSESTLWNGNETRDLTLPVTVPTDCDPEDMDCPYGMSLLWEASTEIQTGDVLIVRIDDRTLRQDNPDSGFRHKEPDTAVYQVNRSGHDHCDVTDGTLLDITPLVVEGNKLITLYDKDLTEGVNLLIVVSQLWGSQCIRLKVTVKSDNCGENADCSNKGVCFSNVSMEGFECQCCPGYIGPHCEEKDACYPSPCKSNSICVDLSQGHDGETFQCLCPYGYTGKTCEERTDPCESSPCENGGKCLTNETDFRCECQTGYSGDRCQHPADLCSESPCKHGICVSQPDGYKCFCRPGFAGENCEYEFNECESSPCLNGGTCMDQIGSYQCICGRGYNGKRCHIKVDLCDPEPCPEGRICEDRGNNYSCECPKGYSGAQCNEPLKAVCSSNPCRHGGTCWSSVDSFYCACRPGYTGKTCGQEVVVEEVESPLPSSTEDLQHRQGDLPSTVTLKLDKLHNVYIAVGTLASALFIVVLTVAACHCRVHETYKKCFLNSTPLLPCKIRKLDVLPKHSRTVKPLLGYPKDGQMPSMPARNFPALDTTEVYYTLDFSDNQNAPLIQ